MLEVIRWLLVSAISALGALLVFFIALLIVAAIVWLVLGFLFVVF